MILMGDEVRHTQRGNNNAYCQDNEISWFDWTLVDKHADLHRFVSLLTGRRRLRDLEPGKQRTSLTALLREAIKEWHGVRLNQPDWSDESHSIALRGELGNQGFVFYLILNAYWQPLEFELPAAPFGKWRRWIDTSLESPNDIVNWTEAPEVTGNQYRASDRSVVMLYASDKD
jgi:isoamylase